MRTTFWEVMKRTAGLKGLIAGVLWILLMAGATESLADCAQEADAFAAEALRQLTGTCSV